MITSFRRTFLSNFYPCRIVFEGAEYPSAEHAYQAAKTVDFLEREKIRCAPSAARAKKLGKLVTIRPNWESIRVDTMRMILREKFSNYHLQDRLQATAPQPLIEGNTWGDQFWGAVWTAGVWVGDNHLGRLLEEIREQSLR